MKLVARRVSEDFPFRRVVSVPIRQHLVRGFSAERDQRRERGRGPRGSRAGQIGAHGDTRYMGSRRARRQGDQGGWLRRGVVGGRWRTFWFASSRT
jgi:hypothetical protein